MNTRLSLTILAVLALGGGTAYYLYEAGHEHSASGTGAHGHAHDHGHGAHDEAEEPKGPHGGRLLVDGQFAVELAIVERGRPPEFRAWFTEAGKQISPSAVTLTVELSRPGGAKDQHIFTPDGDAARSDSEVYEPHSFDVAVTAVHGSSTHRWMFASPEMQTTLSPAVAEQSGVVVETAGPASLRETLSVYGAVKLNADRIGRAVPRFGGVVREARKALGETVSAGEVVALVEANQSLSTLPVTSPIAGVIVDRAVSVGETVSEGSPLYTVADLSEVWVDLNVPKRDQAKVRVGQSVVIRSDDGGAEVPGKIGWISPISSPEAQTAIARVVLGNPDQRWRPGLQVTASITLGDFTVPVAVKESALQTLFDFTVVFSQHGDIYQGRPLELGRRSGGLVEVRKGLSAGERYVTENSFLIKADIGKAGAAHDH